MANSANILEHNEKSDKWKQFKIAKCELFICFKRKFASIKVSSTNAKSLKVFQSKHIQIDNDLTKKFKLFSDFPQINLDQILT